MQRYKRKHYRQCSILKSKDPARGPGYISRVAFPLAGGCNNALLLSRGCFVVRVPLIIVSGRQSESHQQIIDQISDQVALGLLRPGDRLDTLTELQTELHLAHATVARAYVALESRGIIETARRRGSFIAKISASLFSELRREYAARQFAPIVARLRYARVKPRDMLAALKQILEEEEPKSKRLDAE